MRSISEKSHELSLNLEQAPNLSTRLKRNFNQLRDLHLWIKRIYSLFSITYGRSRSSSVHFLPGTVLDLPACVHHPPAKCPMFNRTPVVARKTDSRRENGSTLLMKQHPACCVQLLTGYLGTIIWLLQAEPSSFYPPETWCSGSSVHLLPVF